MYIEINSTIKIIGIIAYSKWIHATYRILKADVKF
jgi:hypothetical protein